MAFAAAAATWLAFVFNDALVEISITFVVTYMTFYVAEELLHVSGVLAVVVLGVMMRATASNRISPEVHVPLHVFWEMLEYFANTLIFIYSGVIIAVEICESAVRRMEENLVKDWLFASLSNSVSRSRRPRRLLRSGAVLRAKERGWPAFSKRSKRLVPNLIALTDGEWPEAIRPMQRFDKVA